MSQITAEKLAEVVGGTLLCGDPSQVIKNISIDSRDVGDNAIFVPIIGAKVDGHRFIEGAFSKGAAATFTSEHDSMKDESHAWIRVEDTVAALQRMGGWAREQITCPVVGITGSVGKTTTREMVSAALSAGGKVAGTRGNSNGQLGVPLTLWGMEKDADFAVLEMGMSEPGEMERIAAIAQPDLGIVTNIGVSHIENLGSRERICEEKLHMADGFLPGMPMILNGDDDQLQKYRDTKKFAPVYYGLGEGNDFRAENIRMEGGRTSFTVTGNGKRTELSLGIPGMHNVMNALAALAAADILRVPWEAAAEKLSAFSGFARRLQVKSEGGYLYIDDTYNASPDSMRAAMQVLSSMEVSGRRLAILADMLELGPDAPRYHYETGQYGAAQKIDQVITVGELARHIGRAYEEAGIPVISCASNQEAAEAAKAWRRPGDAILLKGSNGMHLTEVMQALTAAE